MVLTRKAEEELVKLHEFLTISSKTNSMRKDLSAPSLAIAVAIYVPEQYARLLATAEDASDLETMLSLYVFATQPSLPQKMTAREFVASFLPSSSLAKKEALYPFTCEASPPYS